MENLTEKEKQVDEIISNNPLYVQRVYLSNDAHPCEPVPVTFTLERNEYPFVKEAPAHDNMVYDWSNFTWVDQDPKAQGTRIAKLEEAQDKVLETVENLKKTSEEAAKDNSELTKTLSALQNSITESNKANADNNAKLIEMMSTLMTSQAAPVAPSTTDQKKEGEE